MKANRCAPFFQVYPVRTAARRRRPLPVERRSRRAHRRRYITVHAGTEREFDAGSNSNALASSMNLSLGAALDSGGRAVGMTFAFVRSAIMSAMLRRLIMSERP